MHHQPIADFDGKIGHLLLKGGDPDGNMVAHGRGRHHHLRKIRLEIFALIRVQPLMSVGDDVTDGLYRIPRSEEHTSEPQTLMRISYAVFCLKKNKTTKNKN